LRDYEDLVVDAHKLGMKVLIDYIVNHVGPHNLWATDPPADNWFHGTPQRHLPPKYSFDGLVDPHATARQYRDTLEGWFANQLPDLNPDNPLVGQYVTENALWWTEIAQLDGFRLDTFPYSSRHFWSGWHTSIRRVFPGLFTIGEVSDPDPTITSFFQGGRTQLDGVDSGVTTVFDFPLYYALRDVVLRGAPMQRIIDVLRRDSLYPHPDELVTFIGNHDSRRFMGETGSSRQKLEAAFSLLLTMRGIPEIYSGDEIGMLGGDDPDNRRDFPGGFPGDPRNAFTAAGRTPDEQHLFTHVQSLLRLRQAHPALRVGRQCHIAWDDTFYAFLRQTPEERLLVIFNNAARQRKLLEIPLRDTPLGNAGGLEKLFGPGEARLSGDKVHVTIPETSVAVYRVDQVD
jgi:glycosidase